MKAAYSNPNRVIFKKIICLLYAIFDRTPMTKCTEFSVSSEIRNIFLSQKRDLMGQGQAGKQLARTDRICEDQEVSQAPLSKFRMPIPYNSKK